jgi:exopolysaccharide biosynthesis protein
LCLSSILIFCHNPEKHNTLEGIQKESSDGTWISDAFVGGAWLVKNGKASTPESFNDLYGFDANRNRAFWGINQAGQPVVGVTRTMIDSVNLGKMLQKLGYRDAIMVDSGASAAVVYKGESQVSYTPRPVPHAIALYPADYEEVSGPNFVQASVLKK